MDHREIAVRVPVMNEMQFLFPSEPCKSLKPRSLYVACGVVQKDRAVARQRSKRSPIGNSPSHERCNRSLS
jgi:hypothetical protein